MKRLPWKLGLVLTLVLSASGSAVAAGLMPGDILVSDIGNATLDRVDPITGNRSIFSGGGVGMGTDLMDPRGIAVDHLGNVIVADDINQALYLINPLTGDRTVISGGAVGTGVSFVAPLGVSVGSNGFLYVADGGSGVGTGFVVRVNEATGERTLVSGTGTGTGMAFDNPVGIVAGPGGRLYLTDQGTFADPARVFAVDLTTGARTVVSGGGVGTGTDLTSPRGIVLTSSGQLATADAGGSVIGIDPATGNRVSLSNGSGPAFTYPYGVTVDAFGRLLVTDPGDPALGTISTLFLLDPTTGDRTILSMNGMNSGDPFNLLDIGVTVYHGATAAVPEPSSLMLLALGIIALTLPGWKRTAKRDHRTAA
jgi:sugar lactone lactonase YvrE